MSAQPVALLADSAAPSAAAEEQYAEIAPALENALEAFDPALVQHVLTSNQLNTAHQLTGLEQARAAYGLTGSGQTVVVIDSGIAYDHQALGGGFGTGYRVVGGWDFAENDADPYDDGPAGFHGTHVAGILGSSDATYSGVAPGVDIVALRVFDDRGAGSFSWTEQALQWVHLHRNDFENPITTINLSLGAAWNSHAPPNWATLEDEFAQLESDGIFISVSAGNSFATYNAKGLSYPAASSYVVPVASVDTNGNLSSFSQRHDRVIAAPGRNITSTVPDYVFGADGIKNDYVAASGTSMAAPYVAGAATLIREAMQFVGIQNITQDKIYDTMWSTADLVYDAVTNGHYHRLNVLRALESVLPADDAGSTAATARSLGNVGTSTSFSGLINARGDIDVISFTAGMSGRMSMAFDTASNLNLRAELLGGQSSFANQVLSFDVTAGTTYAVAIRGGEDVGHYDAHAELRVAAQAIGAVDLRQLAGVQVQGEAWYQVTAVRSGTFTALASFANGAGNVDLRICDAQHQLIASAQTQADWERLDVQVTAGQTLYVCLQGYNSDVDLTLANLVQNQGSTVRVFGTAANDQFTLTSGSQVTIAVQGVQYQFAATAVGVVEFQGGEGADTATITGSAGNLQLRWNDVQVVGGNHGGSEGENSGGSSGSSGVGTELARKAYDLDQQYGFKFGGSYHANWGVPGAKWIQDKAGGWWFLLNDGRLFQWNGTTRFMTSKHVATLDASYNADPRKLYDAEPPAETGSGANSGGGTNSGSEARNGADTGSGTGQTGGDGTNNGTGGTQGGGSSQGSSGTGGSSSSGSNSNGAAITDV
ncbi:MAG: S8 family serine peptidase, partial [Pirellulaceae bacterium]